MRLIAALSLLFVLADGPTRPEPAIPYFTNVRDVYVSQADHQNYFVVDEELWSHSRPDLGDLRLYDGDSPVQYFLSEQRAGISSEEVEAKILNLGSVAGHTEFDLDVAGLAEYDRIRLRIDAHDFVVTASVSGGTAPGRAAEVELTPSTLYDFTKEQLGSNFLLKLPPSSFRYLHIKLSPGIRPQEVKGAIIYNLHEQRASWAKAGSCNTPQQKPHVTTIVCNVAEKAPLSRFAFHVAPEQVNFRRAVGVEDAKGVQIAAGEISRVRVNRAGTLVTAKSCQSTSWVVPARSRSALITATIHLWPLRLPNRWPWSNACISPRKERMRSTSTTETPNSQLLSTTTRASSTSTLPPCRLNWEPAPTTRSMPGALTIGPGLSATQ